MSENRMPGTLTISQALGPNVPREALAREGTLNHLPPG